MISATVFDFVYFVLSRGLFPVCLNPWECSMTLWWMLGLLSSSCPSAVFFTSLKVSFLSTFDKWNLSPATLCCNTAAAVHSRHFQFMIVASTISTRKQEKTKQKSRAVNKQRNSCNILCLLLCKPTTQTYYHQLYHHLCTRQWNTSLELGQKRDRTQN